jgi:hypothetical protein
LNGAVFQGKFGKGRNGVKIGHSIFSINVDAAAVYSINNCPWNVNGKIAVQG